MTLPCARDAGQNFEFLIRELAVEVLCAIQNSEDLQNQPNLSEDVSKSCVLNMELQDQNEQLKKRLEIVEQRFWRMVIPFFFMQEFQVETQLHP